MTVSLEDIIKNLPNKPGIYQFFDKNGELIYIGKAKNLRKRVESYFNKKNQPNNKLRVLVRKIWKIQHILVETESDALLLENNFIKKYQPRYNISLKDDKTFPWICIKNEPFPRVFSTRNYIADGSKYYGPYTSAVTVKTLLTLIKQLYTIRTCNYLLTKKNIDSKKFKVCLEFHIGNCKGPCENLQSEEDYNISITQIHDILKGNLKELLSYLEKIMKDFAGKFDYENAQIVKTKIDALNKFQLKSTIVSQSISDVDVLSIKDDVNSAYVNFIKVINGAIVQAYNIELKKKLNEQKEELLEFALIELRDRLNSNAREIILPFKIKNFPVGARISVPIKGDKKKLLDLSERNAVAYMFEQKRQHENISEKRLKNNVLEKLQKDLRMSEIPYHIECFDNSNIQGSDPVAACVVFKNGNPVKKDYRHFNVKTVKGPDDFASMREIVLRRYSSQLEKNEALPQLVIIDGGKGQISSAMESLELLQLRGKITLIGIAKRLEEIYFPEDPVPLYLDKNSESLRIIQKIRNEAHRFSIKLHRNKRSNNMTVSELISIKGIGEKTMRLLIQSLHSVENIKNSDVETLEKLMGKSKAKIIFNYFSTKM